ncbi:MAG TPA: response regulator transcription factor [Gaiellales bacterium]|nr:response regulator transcription factor [Gaiellales bacterium]
MHILVVEDDAPLAKIVKKSLESGGHTVDVAIDGQEGLDLGRGRSHDAVVLDIQLPKVNGMDVCRMLREDGNQVPIIMLTARSAVADRITGLDAGADDYLPKPFSLAELQARLRALSRRGRPNGTEVLEAGPLTLDPAARELRVNGSAVEMTGTELALLEHLMQNAGVVLSRDQLREHVWGDGPEPTSNVVDIYVHYVRRKLRAAGVTDDPIRTVRGLGYAFRRQE